MMQAGTVAAMQLQDRLLIALTVLAMLGAVVLTGVMVCRADVSTLEGSCFWRAEPRTMSYKIGLDLKSPREKKLLRRFAIGKTDKEIGQELGDRERIAAQRQRIREFDVRLRRKANASAPGKIAIFLIASGRLKKRAAAASAPQQFGYESAVGKRTARTPTNGRPILLSAAARRSSTGAPN